MYIWIQNKASEVFRRKISKDYTIDKLLRNVNRDDLLSQKNENIFYLSKVNL